MKAVIAGVIAALCISNFSEAFELGKLALSGSGCFGGSKVVAIEGESSRYALPVRVRLNKKGSAAFDRKTCNMRLPVDLNAGEKLQIWNISQTVRVIAAKDSEVKSSLSVSLVGTKANPLAFTLKAVEESVSVIENLKSDGLIAESACGSDTIITGDLNILATGNAKALATTGTALVTLKIVNCN
jgi:hypothetical protein